MSFTYDYARPAITADILLFAWDLVRKPTFILLIKRKLEPFKDCWALPGGFVDIIKNERWPDAAVRELEEETGITKELYENLHPVGVFDEPNRDPRGRVIAQAFYGVLDHRFMSKAIPSDDASELEWFNIAEQLPPMAFDHAEIIGYTLLQTGIK